MRKGESTPPTVGKGSTDIRWNHRGNQTAARRLMIGVAFDQWYQAGAVGLLLILNFNIFFLLIEKFKLASLLYF